MAKIPRIYRTYRSDPEWTRRIDDALKTNNIDYFDGFITGAYFGRPSNADSIGLHLSISGPGDATSALSEGALPIISRMNEISGLMNILGANKPEELVGKKVRVNTVRGDNLIIGLSYPSKIE